jgi:hypothetical protein
VSQHTPSTQKPEPHSVLVEQAIPCGLLQVPALPGVLHFAPPEQLAVEQQTPSTQLPDEQAPGFVDEHVAPSASFTAHAPDLQ